MSRLIQPALRNHLAGESTSLALIWQITRRDGAVFGFTDHDQDITFEGVTYVSAGGFNASAVSTQAAFNVDNLDVEGMFASDVITEADIMAGVWDNAEIRVQMVNWADLGQGAMKIRRGWIGQVKTGKTAFTAELRGMMQKLQQNIGEVFSPTCRADFADDRCKLAVADFTFAATVTTVISKRVFKASALDQDDHYFDYGMVTWITGENAGLQMEVKTFTKTDAVVELQLPMPFPISEGDTFTIIAGCDRSFTTCKDRFDNVINYRGEPHLPGVDRILLWGKNGTT